MFGRWIMSLFADLVFPFVKENRPKIFACVIRSLVYDCVGALIEVISTTSTVLINLVKEVSEFPDLTGWVISRSALDR